MNITPYELLEMILEKYSIEETIILVNNLLYDLENNPRKFMNDLSNLLEDVALSKDKCPLCTSDIEVVVVDNEEREYQGFTCYEEIHKRQCSDSGCSYTTE